MTLQDIYDRWSIVNVNRRRGHKTVRIVVWWRSIRFARARRSTEKVLFRILFFRKRGGVSINVHYAGIEKIGSVFRPKLLFSISFWSACCPYVDLNR